MEDQVLFSERCLRLIGRRMTPQRRLVVDILSQAEGHLDATDIHERGRHHDARLSLATVYRALNILKEAGVVRELHLDDEHHHYELDHQDKHSHLICRSCGQVIEVDSTAFVEVARAIGQAHDFEIASTHVELTGYCTDCRR